MIPWIATFHPMNCLPLHMGMKSGSNMRERMATEPTFGSHITVRPRNLSTRQARLERKISMKHLSLALLLLGTLGIPLSAQGTKVTPLIDKPLTGIPGKEGLMATVTFPPGASDEIHRHNAHVFVYVLAGKIIMKVRGGKLVTLGPGQTFYEAPNDIHVVGKNASSTEPAKFLVFFVKDKGAPVLVPAR
jgi:quercetin dioxygenase-like cupin family protein